MSKTVRVGIIGAGNFTTRRTIPNLIALPDVEVVAVANRSLTSAEVVSKEFGIASAMDDWRALVTRDDVDAVVIGSPPYVHRDVAIAAFEAGKDVLCQTRMARTLEEAKEMAQKARETGRVGMVFPPDPYTEVRPYVKHLLTTGYVGRVRQVFYHYQVSEMADTEAPLGRRNDPEMYGYPNYLGLYWDTLRPWFGEATRVLADARIFTPERSRRSDGTRIKSAIPEATTAIAETESGAIVTMIHSETVWFGKNQVEIYGEEGTLVCLPRGEIMGAHKTDKELASLPVPPEMKDEWRVEEQFVQLVRGESEFTGPTFDDGVKNMEYLEACRRSAAEGRWVELPLP